MTKEQFINKWGRIYEIKKTKPAFTADLEAVIATEIAKVQPEKTNKIEITPHTLVEVNRAFRALKQDRNSYIHKVFSDDGVFDAMEEIRKMFDNYFVEQPQEKPALNPIAEAYERGEKIRHKGWHENSWIQKLSETESIDELKNTYDDTVWAFRTEPHKWELYTEPTEQTSSQGKLDNSFDRERFERMFRAVIETHEATMNALKQLDAFYASKEGGNNGI